MTTATLFIGGTWSAASDGGTREIRCPADGELAGIVSEANAYDAVRAVAAARAAFDGGEWAGVPALERGSFLLRVAARLRERKDEFARAETLDTGKRLVESEIDMDDIANCFEYFGKIAGQDSGRLVDAGSSTVVSRIEYEPVGVCALIAPWNYPLLQAAWKIAPALAAGCSFVLKPSELTPHTAILMMEVLEELGLPSGVANLVLGDGKPWVPCFPETRTLTSSPSRAGSKPARPSPLRPPPRSRRWRWSWAARTPTSSSLTPTSTPPWTTLSTPPSCTPVRSARPARA